MAAAAFALTARLASSAADTSVVFLAISAVGGGGNIGVLVGNDLAGSVGVAVAFRDSVLELDVRRWGDFYLRLWRTCKVGGLWVVNQPRITHLEQKKYFGAVVK